VSDELITDGDTPPEIDVQGQQEPVDWKREPVSDERLSDEAVARLGEP